MVKAIRVKKTAKWKDVDQSLISALEFKCLDEGFMVNISDGVAREMIKKGWVINLDPMKEVKSERKAMEVKKSDLPEGVVNPGLKGSEDADKGTASNVPPERPDEKIQPKKGSGKRPKKGSGGKTKRKAT